MAQQNSQYRLGWIPDLPDQRDHLYAAPQLMMAKLPQLYDLRKHYKLPPVYDQGQLGSCTANAIASALQFDRRRQKLKDFPPSRLFIYYNERAMEGTINSDSGAYIRDGIKSVATDGDCPEKEWKYDIAKFSVHPPQKCYDDALKYAALSYQRNPHILSQMKGCLASGFPFVFGVSVYQSFMDAADGNIPMPGANENLLGGHAILAVGYYDKSSVFYFRNSWGKDWGQKGYGSIPYAYLLDNNLSDDFWTLKLVQ